MTPAAHAARSPAVRLAEELRHKLTEALGQPIRVVLFGSQARGEATEESDLDVLVVLPNLEKSTLDTVLEIASYYAMFYAVPALLTTLGKGSSKHSGVISLFDQYLVKSGELPETMSKALHKAFDMRQIADYRELYPMERKQAEEALASADRFVEAVDNYLVID